MTTLTSALTICGAGHSGSTLLGLILDGHPSCFYAGEAGKVRYLHDDRKPLRKRACKLCGEDCPIWSRFVWDRGRPLYPQIATHVGRPIVIDSTKKLEWIRQRHAELDSASPPRLLLLLRDGRAVVNSRLRKYPERDPESQIRTWLEQMERSYDLYNAFQGPRITVRYEELATTPATVIGNVCDLLQLPFEPAMLEFDACEHHPLGGNNGTQYQVARARAAEPEAALVALASRSRAYYRDHPSGIRLDLRWKDEMQPSQLGLFDRIAGTFNAPLAWGD